MQQKREIHLHTPLSTMSSHVLYIESTLVIKVSHDHGNDNKN